jgi:glycosyltransferase involved in cell wall biosynthesis
MYRGQTVAVVVPAYNEAGFVGGVVDTLPSFVDRAYVVDDCSTDSTFEEMQRHAAAANTARRLLVEGDSAGIDGPRGPDDEFVTAIRNAENRGVGYSITTGYRRALADGADVVAVLNGDGQMDPDVLPRILDPIVDGRADYAKGNRLRDSPERLGMSAWRLFGNWTLTFLTRVSSGYWRVSDSQNGYTAISRHALETIDLDGLYERYGFLNDLLTELNVHDLRVADVPHPARYGGERSGISYPNFIRTVSLLLLWNFLYRLKVKYVVPRFHPTVLYYALGGVGVLTGLVVGLAFLSSALGLEVVTVDGWLVLGVLAGGGFFSLLAAVVDARQSADLEVLVSDLSTGER